MSVRRDLAPLKRHITIPAEITEGRWLAVPRGVPSAIPGPTDLMLLARFPLKPAAWASLGRQLGEARPAQRIEIDARLRDVLPGAPQAIEGEIYGTAPFENAQWKGGWAIWDGEALVVQLFSQ